MLSPRNRARATVVLGLLAPSAAFACTVARTSIHDLPGVHDYAWPEGSIDVPRNLAVFDGATQRISALASYTETTLGDAAMPTLTPMPSAGTQIVLSAGGWAVGDGGVRGPSVLNVIDYIDTEAPSAPVVGSARDTTSDAPSGCSSTTCGGVPSFVVRLTPSTDDFTPAERITYAVYIGTTVESASGSLPIEYRIADDGTVDSLTVQNSGIDQYVAVQAIDQAGNRSPLSTPVLVVGKSGCSTAPRSADAAVSMIIVIASLAVRRIRRRTASDASAQLARGSSAP